MHPSSSTRTSSVFSESEEKVHLGEGIMCSKYAHQVLNTVKEHSDWAITLLTGVYGDKAQYMRYGKPRSPDLQSFSPYFVNVAKYHYRKWLESFTVEKTKNRKYSSAQIEDLINSLPVYLSKRCIDMKGSRLKKSASGERSQRSDPNRNKRPYQRRGSLSQHQQQGTTQQLQFNQEPLIQQQLQNNQQNIEQPNIPTLPQFNYLNWQTPHNVSEPVAVPIISNSSMSDCETEHSIMNL